MTTLAAFYLSVSLLLLAVVLIALPTILKKDIEKAAKKLSNSKK